MSVERVPELGAERLGTVLLGKYKLDRVLGSGGMAIVYAATHRNQKRFAVKVLHPELSRVKDLRQRFLREGYVANTVDHPGAVAVIDDDVAPDGSAVLVMELLHGSTVEAAQDAAGGRLGARTVLAVAHDLLDVLGAAHAHGIVHRDVKPANLFLTTDGTLKVLDFGIARVREAMGGGAGATTTGAMLGTPAFMAPEQAGGRASLVDHRTDLWAVGAAMFTMLTSELVHVGETAQHVAMLAATTPARKLATVLPDIDPRVAALVDRALEFDAMARWQSAAEMRVAVAEASIAVFGVPVGREARMPGAVHHASLGRLPERSFPNATDGAHAATVAGFIPEASPARSLPNALSGSATASQVGVTTEQPAMLPRVGRGGRTLLGVGMAVALVGIGAYAARSLGSTPSASLTTPPPPPSAPQAAAVPGQGSPALGGSPATGALAPEGTALDEGRQGVDAVEARPPPTAGPMEKPRTVDRPPVRSTPRLSAPASTPDAGSHAAAPATGGDWDKR